MAGAPSTLDMFDYKPKLNELNGKPCPESYMQGQQFAFIKGVPKLLGSPHKFASTADPGRRCPRSCRTWQSVADELCIVSSMHTDQFNHAPASFSPHRLAAAGPARHGLLAVLRPGQREPRPAELRRPRLRHRRARWRRSLWGSGFLPTIHQGVQLRSQGDPVLFLSNPPGMIAEQRRQSLDTLKALNELHLDDSRRSRNRSRAFRNTRWPIGCRPACRRSWTSRRNRRKSTSCTAPSRARNRSPTIACWPAGWWRAAFASCNSITGAGTITAIARTTTSAHGLVRALPGNRPAVAALIKDLKQRGLLDSTLVVWGGEFGRTPMNEERNGSKWLGRDHHQHAFTIWMAGGGVKPGITLGATDELGYHAVEDRVHVHDLQATILHLLGLNHEKLTYRFQGRDYRLTDVHGKVVEKVLA